MLLPLGNSSHSTLKICICMSIVKLQDGVIMDCCIRKEYKKIIQKKREQCWKCGLGLRHAGLPQEGDSTEDSW